MCFIWFNEKDASNITPFNLLYPWAEDYHLDDDTVMFPWYCLIVNCQIIASGFSLFVFKYDYVN